MDLVKESIEMDSRSRSELTAAMQLRAYLLLPLRDALYHSAL